MVTLDRVPPVYTRTKMNTLISTVESFANGFTASGTFIAPPSYTIAYDGADYHACNAYQTLFGGPADAGGVDGGDCYDVVNAAIQAAITAGGGRVAFKAGVYPIDTQIIVNTQYPRLLIEGAGSNTKLNFSGDGACFLLQAEAERVILRDFEINLSGDSDYGVKMLHGHKNIISHVDIYGEGDGDGRIGIVIAGESHWNSIQDCLLEDIQTGIFGEYVVEGAVGWPIFNNIYNTFIHDVHDGIHLEGTDWYVDGTSVQAFDGIGLRIGGDGYGSWGVFNKLYCESGGAACTACVQVEALSGNSNFIEPSLIVTGAGEQYINNGVGPSCWVGSKYRHGWYVENVVHGTQFNHGLFDTPTNVQVNLYCHSDDLPVGEVVIPWVMAVDDTTITVGMRYLDGDIVPKVAEVYTIYVQAEYQP